MNISIQIFVQHMFSVLLGIHLGQEHIPESHDNSTFNPWGTTIFQSAVPFGISISGVWELWFPHILTNACYLTFQLQSP